MKFRLKTLFMLAVIVLSLKFSSVISLNKIDTINNYVSKTLELDKSIEIETNLKFNYSLLIAILSVCIGFILSALFLIFALIYHKYILI